MLSKLSKTAQSLVFAGGKEITMGIVKSSDQQFREEGLQFTKHLPNPEYELTPGERAVFMLLGEGRSIEVLAEELCIDEVTAKRRRTRIMHKLHLVGPGDLAKAYARTRTPEDASRARFLVENVLSATVGTTIVSTILIDQDYCALLVRTRNGRMKRLWILDGEVTDRCGWAIID
jgi:DNA-binding CsgD family transcriptional regulator